MSFANTQLESRGRTILISEDELAVRRSLHLLLRSRGYKVHGYTTGTALLADPNAVHADCMIVDYRMPDVDGFSILEQLRKRGWQGNAILITGFYNTGLVRRAREAGFAQVIPKPLIARSVLDAVACQCRRTSDPVG